MAKLKIIWDPETSANLFPDGKVRDAIKELIEALNHLSFLNETEDAMTTVIGQETLIMELRCAVKRGQIKREDLEIHVGDKVITIEESHHLSDWPDDFCFLFDEQASDLWP